MAKSVRTRSESSRSRTGFVRKNPWHNAWRPEDLSKRAKPVRKSILEVFFRCCWLSRHCDLSSLSGEGGHHARGRQAFPLHRSKCPVFLNREKRRFRLNCVFFCFFFFLVVCAYSLCRCPVVKSIKTKMGPPQLLGLQK